MDVKAAFRNAWEEVKEDFSRVAKLTTKASQNQKNTKAHHINELALRIFKLSMMMLMAVEVGCAIAALPIIVSVGGVFALAASVMMFVLSYDAYRIAGNWSHDLKNPIKSAAVNNGFQLIGAVLNSVWKGRVLNEKDANKAYASALVRNTILDDLWKVLLVDQPALRKGILDRYKMSCVVSGVNKFTNFVQTVQIVSK